MLSLSVQTRELTVESTGGRSSVLMLCTCMESRTCKNTRLLSFLCPYRGHFSSKACVKLDFSQLGETTQICMLLLIPPHKHRHTHLDLHRAATSEPSDQKILFILHSSLFVEVTLVLGLYAGCKKGRKIMWDLSSCGIYIYIQRSVAHILSVSLQILIHNCPRLVQQS